MPPRAYSYQPQAIQWRGLRPKTWTVAGWRKMLDVRAKSSEQDQAAPLLVNFQPLDAAHNGALQLRPGIVRLTTPTTTQLPSADEAQWIGHLMTSGGSLLTVVIAGGEIYTLSGSTLTKVVSTANLTTAVITLDNASGVYAIEYNQTLVIADRGGNAPFTWNGAAGAGGLVKLTNAPASRTGGPAIYYAKLFFIKSDRKTIVWSEENQPNTGYEAGGYNNAWALGQNSSDGLCHLLGTNEALYYFRNTSVGAIRGAVSTTFSTDGVHDSITQRTGISAEARPIWLEDAIWWLSRDLHPMVYRPGIGAIDIGEQLARRYAGPQGINAPDLAAYGSLGEQYLSTTWDHLCADRGAGMVRVEGRYVSGPQRVSLVINARDLSTTSLYVYPTDNPPGTMAGAQWSEIVALTGPGNGWSLLYSDTDGYLFSEPVSGSTGLTAQGRDEIDDGAGAAVVGTFLGPMHGWSTNTEWQFTQLDVVADALPNNTLTVGYLTSRRHKVSLAPAQQTVTDASVTNTPYERHRAFGLNANGRWLRPIIKLSGDTSAASRLPVLYGYSLTACPVSTSPSVT